MSPLTIQELRKKAKETSPIVLVTTVEQDLATTKIEYQRKNDTYAYTKLPTTDYSSCKELLYCLQEFNEAARTHGWQGQQQFIKYRLTLRGKARTTWDAAVAGGPNNHQETTFNAAIRVNCEGLNGVGAYDNLLEYLRQAKKLHSMTPSQVAVRLTNLCNYAIFFSQEDGSQGDPIPALLKRQLLVNMHPDHWIKKFWDANLRVRVVGDRVKRW